MADSFTLYPLTISTVEKENRTSVACANDSPALQNVLHQVNALAHGFKQSGFPASLPPPPPNSINPHRSTELEKIKKLGNEAFSRKNYGDALRLYTQAMDLAASRPPWEPSQLAIDELSILLCNRSAAFLGADLLAEAYADAHACVVMKPVWIKGYYRLCRACLRLTRSREALKFVRQGLQYEPKNEDLLALEKEILNAIQDERL